MYDDYKKEVFQNMIALNVFIKDLQKYSDEQKQILKEALKEQDNEDGTIQLKYSPYGSKMEIKSNFGDNHNPFNDSYQKIKNSPNFYQEAPFLTIAEDLLKLIKEDKVDRLIFLSAYDKRKFPYGDSRKVEIFNQTFGSLVSDYKSKIIEGIGTDNNIASERYLLIDDNPNICKSLVETNGVIAKPCLECLIKYENKKWALGSCVSGKCPINNINVLSPYYPSTADQHFKTVLLVKQEVSNLKKEDFSK
ncbi:14258_t:CDS:2 [Funneliformis geosporum]|nr:14258_t:CDS:2 [Funneliformis geosporum]